MTTLNVLVKKEREKHAMVLETLAEKTGISAATLNRMENGESPYSVQDLVKIADALQISIVQLMKDADLLNNRDLKLINSSLNGFNDLTKEHQDEIRRTILSMIDSEKNDKEFRLGELFCGPGGLAYGAIHSRSGDGQYFISHQWANDFDPETCQTYRSNICPTDPDSVICGDVKQLDYDTLKPIDALAFGFPCNDFSVVGEQKGINGVYGPLYTYGVKALKQFQPKWFLAENVGGLKSANSGKTFLKILSDLENAGYVITPHLYKFEEYGIPQARHRVIIVGIRKDIEDVVFHVPSPEPYQTENNTCRNAIENPPIPENAPNHEKTKQDKRVVERLQYIKPGENAFTANLPEHLQLKVKGAKISQIYKRLDPEKPAYTVTGSGGGGTHMYHWSEDRALTNRERARLQTFPDDFVFVGKKESVRKQIGMAVPCQGAEIIFNAILNSFAHIDYPSVPANVTMDFQSVLSDAD